VIDRQLRENTMGDEIELVGPGEPDGDQEQGAAEAAVAEPAKLMRIALMLRELQEEVRRADVDAAGRDRLRLVHERALEQLRSVLSEDLQDELTDLALPFEDGTPTESEIRLAQAQLVGWLEGLFQGIQAAIFNQQMAARAQLEEMRRRSLPPGRHPQQPPGRGDIRDTPTGQYL
jgi:hypothetical protein